MTPELEATIRVMQLVTGLLSVLAVLTALAVPALFWKMRKDFVTRDELNGVGARQTAFDVLAGMARDRADGAHERLDKIESSIEVHLKWIRRDLDIMLEQRKEEKR